MEQEPRYLTDQELEFSIQNQLTIDKQQRITEESNKAEIMKKFNLTYVSYDSTWVSVNSENFSGSIGKYNMGAKINMKCKIDMKDIETFEDFQKIQNIMKIEKQKTMTGLYWIAFRAFQEKV